MKARVIAAASIAASLLLATASLSSAQGQLPRPGQLPPPGQGGPPQRGPAAPPAQPPAQPPAAAAQPYKPLSIAAPAAIADPSFEAFRKQLGAVAGKKDRKALAGLVAPNFFWMGEKGDKADKKKPSVENLAKAIQLDGKEAPGWEMLGAAAGDPTGTPFPDRKDTICSPADPTFNAQEFEALVKSTGTEDGDWAYPTQTGLDVHAGPQPNSPVVEKLGLHFVRVMPDTAPGSQDSPMLRIVTPSGKTGFVPAEALSPLGNDQLCYSKEGAGWKISGFIGGDQ
jgi:hypothetical protein